MPSCWPIRSPRCCCDHLPVSVTVCAVRMAQLILTPNVQRFRPITVERPKVLLPLVNVPMIEYTLEWLAMNKVEEVSCGPGQASF